MTPPESVSCPLSGTVVGLTRPRDRVGPLLSAFTAAGAEAVLLPVFRTVAVEGNPRIELEEALRAFLEGADGWIVCTSGSVIPVLAEFIVADRNLAAPVDSQRFAVVGAATASMARAHGFSVDLIGDGSGAIALANALLDLDPTPRVLQLTSDRGLRDLADRLEAAGGTVVCAVAVEHQLEPTLNPDALWRDPPVDCLVYASPSAADGLLKSCTDRDRLRLKGLPAVAIGTTTATALLASGFSQVITARTPSPEGLVSAVIEWRRAR